MQYLKFHQHMFSCGLCQIDNTCVRDGSFLSHLFSGCHAPFTELFNAASMVKQHPNRCFLMAYAMVMIKPTYL